LRIETGFCKAQRNCFEISHCPVTVHFSIEGVRVRRFERKNVLSYRYRLPVAPLTECRQAKLRIAGLSRRGASASFLWRQRGDPPSPRLRRGWKRDRLPWGKRINDFLEARIAAQRIPHRIQAQVAIAW